MTQDKTRKITVTGDGRIAETVYLKNENNTKFAVSDGKKVIQKPCITSGAEKIYPLNPESSLVGNEIIKLPSQASRYDTQDKLVEDIQEFVHSYLDITNTFEEIIPYYVLTTWLYDRFNEIPYLRALGGYDTGKSRFLTTVGSICYKAIFAGGATTVSPIFRILDEHGGTLILDEADYSKSDKSQKIIKILNAGYSRDNSTVMRSRERDGTYDPEVFEVYGPKIVATRDRFDDQALESRMLVEKMVQRKLRDDIPLMLGSEFREKARQLRNKLLQWRFDNYFKKLPEKDDINADVQPRLRQIVLPLARIANSEKVERKLGALIKSHDKELAIDRRNSLRGEVFEALIKCSKNNYTPTVKAITEELNKSRNGYEEIHPRKTGAILKNQLQLSTERGGGGNYCVNIRDHQEHIKILKERYGLNR